MGLKFAAKNIRKKLRFARALYRSSKQFKFSAELSAEFYDEFYDEIYDEFYDKSKFLILGVVGCMVSPNRWLIP